MISDSDDLLEEHDYVFYLSVCGYFVLTAEIFTLEKI